MSVARYSDMRLYIPRRAPHRTVWWELLVSTLVRAPNVRTYGTDAVIVGTLAALADGVGAPVVGVQCI